MNYSRESKITLLLSIVGLVVFVGGGYLFVWQPLQDFEAQASSQESSRNDNALKLKQIMEDRKLLTKWQKLSLPLPLPKSAESKGKDVKFAAPVVAVLSPKDRDDAQRETEIKYTDFLESLMRRHNLYTTVPHKQGQQQTVAAGAVKGAPPVYTAIVFSVKGRGDWSDIVKMLDEFQKAPFMHRLNQISVGHSQGQSNKVNLEEPLTVEMTVEALIVNHQLKPMPQTEWVKFYETDLFTGKRETLYPPTTPPRDYAAVSVKNMFTGAIPKIVVVAEPPQPKPKTFVKPDPPPPPPTPRALDEVIRYAHLMRIAGEEKQLQAVLRDRAKEQGVELRAEPGQHFPLLLSGEKNTVVQAEVLNIQARGIVFRVGLNASEAKAGAANPYPSAQTIYRVEAKDLEKLVKEKLAKADEASRIYVVNRPYWDGFVIDGLVAALRFGSTVSFKHGLVNGQVLGKLGKDDKLVYLRLEEKYCGYRDPEKRIFVSPHEGFCQMEVGQSLIQAFQSPIPDAAVREMLTATRRDR